MCLPCPEPRALGARARSLSRSLSRARALSLSRSLDLSLSLSLARARSLSRSLALARSSLSLSRSLALSLLALCLSLALSLSLARSLSFAARSLARACSLSLARSLALPGRWRRGPVIGTMGQMICQHLKLDFYLTLRATLRTAAHRFELRLVYCDSTSLPPGKTDAAAYPHLYFLSRFFPSGLLPSPPQPHSLLTSPQSLSPRARSLGATAERGTR